MQREVEEDLCPQNFPEPGLWRADHQQDPAAGTRVAQGKQGFTGSCENPIPSKASAVAGTGQGQGHLPAWNLNSAPFSSRGPVLVTASLPSVWVCLCPRGGPTTILGPHPMTVEHLPTVADGDSTLLGPGWTRLHRGQTASPASHQEPVVWQELEVNGGPISPVT